MFFIRWKLGLTIGILASIDALVLVELLMVTCESVKLILSICVKFALSGTCGGFKWHKNVIAMK